MDATITANGHRPAVPALLPLTIPLPDAGPAEKWPRHAPAAQPRRWVQPPPGTRTLPIVPRAADDATPEPAPPADAAEPDEPDAAPSAKEAPPKPAPVRRMTGGQRGLGGLIVLLALLLTPVFFIVMFITVNNMLGPYFEGWAWTVPVATELTFTLLFLWALLMEWTRNPSHALWIAPYPFAVMSAVLNVWAAHGNIPGMLGHLAVTLAFFTPVTFAKMGVRRMLVTDEERHAAAALKDAQAHARDMLRSGLGITWRFRAPVLLRRQLRAGRLPAKVMEAVASGNATEWESAVEAWIGTAVALPERTREVLRAARAEALARPLPTPAESLSGTPSGGTPGTPSETPADGTPEALPEAPPKPPSRRTPKPPRLIPSKASDADLAGLIVPLLAEGEVSPTKVVKVIKEETGGKSSIGHERAKTILALAVERKST